MSRKAGSSNIVIELDDLNLNFCTDSATWAIAGSENEEGARKEEEQPTNCQPSVEEDSEELKQWNNAGMFSLLPSEIIEYILPMLDAKGFSSLTRCCKSLHSVCSFSTIFYLFSLFMCFVVIV